MVTPFYREHRCRRREGGVRQLSEGEEEAEEAKEEEEEEEVVENGERVMNAGRLR